LQLEPAAVAKLRAALVGLVGVDTREELEQMEAVMRLAKGVPDEDRANMINAIHALRDTLPEAPGAA